VRDELCNTSVLPPHCSQRSYPYILWLIPGSLDQTSPIPLQATAMRIQVQTHTKEYSTCFGIPYPQPRIHSLLTFKANSKVFSYTRSLNLT
jgi:hypothetical protein